jgi:hypothetical protein
MKWINSIGLNIKMNTEKCIDHQRKQNIKNLVVIKLLINQQCISKTKKLNGTCTKGYLKSIGSFGIVHSIDTEKYARFIMCNIRIMNECHDMHEDYFKISNIYINFSDNSSHCILIEYYVIKNHEYGNP